jgi:hypothetical protein
MKIEYIDNIFSIKPQHFLMHVSSYPFCFHSSTKKTYPTASGVLFLVVKTTALMQW